MRFRDLDLNLLVALDALLTEKSVSLAARRVHLKQSAMSSALSRLRQYFKDDLLASAGREMVLTPRAEALVGPVREALRQIETTILSAPEAVFDARTSQRSFSVIASDDLIDSFLAPALRTLEKLAPRLGVELLLPTEETPDVVLGRGSADLLLVQEPYASAQHPRRVLFDDEYVIVAWSGNRQIDTGLSKQQFMSATHVLVRFLGGRRGAPWEELAFQRLAQRRAAVIAPDFSSVPLLVVGTGRVATMHRRHAQLYARSLPLKLLPCPIRIPRVRQVLQWPTRKDGDPGLEWLVEALVCEARREPAPV
jgi:LysR family transcriptional regulator, nod-box dependent transcriptional activator